MDPNVSDPRLRLISAMSISRTMLRDSFPPLLPTPASRSISGSPELMFGSGNRPVEMSPGSEVEWSGEARLEGG